MKKHKIRERLIDDRAKSLGKGRNALPKEDRIAGPPTQNIPSPLEDHKDGDLWFCCIPFTMMYTTEMGEYSACNFAIPSKEHNIKNTSIEDWMTKSEYMNKLRTEMLDKNSKFEVRNDKCSKCVFDEKNYGTSRRLNVTGRYAQDREFWPLIKRSVDKFYRTGKWNFTDRILEAQLKIFGTECNLDCFMCMPFSSDMRQKNMYVEGREFHKDIWGEKERHKVLSIKANKSFDPDMIKQLVNLAPYLRTLKIIGGEPLIMKKQYELLDALIECGQSKHIKIKYQTNLTKTKSGDHNIFDYIPHFELVNVVVSIDGVGKYNDYLRRRSSYKEIVQNIDLMNKYPNVKIDLNAIVTIPGVLRLYELFEFYKNRPDLNDMNWWMIYDPKAMRVHNLPQELKDMILPYYRKYPEAHDIVKALEKESDSDYDFHAVIKYLLDRDKHYKGTKWEMHLFDVFPELERFYDAKKTASAEILNISDDWRNWP